MSDPKYYIPKYTDEPERIMFCTINELFFGAILFMGLSWLGHEMIAIIVFVSAILCIRRLKTTIFKDGIGSFLYWHLPAITPLDRNLPNSCDREFLG